MLTTSCQSKRNRRQPFWNMLAAIVVLVGVLGFFSVHAGPAHASATTPPPPFPSVDQIGHPAAQTAAEKAYAADKTKLANEYVQQVRSGKETLATFETHYRAFMLKWRLGNVANLHTALTRSAARVRSNAARLSGPECPSVLAGPAVSCPVYAAQFPEESFNWCGPSTLSTTLVEDSYTWPGTTSYNGYTLSYNHYVVSQPSNLATSDELWLAQNGVIINDGTYDWVHHNGSSVNLMTTMVDNFVGGKGGWYAQEWLSGSMSSQVADFQGKVSTDIGTGWDVPTGIVVPAYSGASMPGYPVNYPYDINHWIPVTFISSDQNTTYYSDPIYAAPAYTSPTWTIPPPYEYTSTYNLVWWSPVILW